MSSGSKDGAPSRLEGASASNDTSQPQGRKGYLTFTDVPKDPETASGQPPEHAKYADLADKLDFTKIFQLHKAPCGREGLLTGIGAGVAVGIVRFILGGMLRRN